MDRHEPAPDAQPSPPPESAAPGLSRDRSFAHDGLVFRYREAGAGAPFVFQHGLGADASQTFGLIHPPAGWRLLTLECRAHGETRPVGPEDRLSIPCFVEDVIAWMDHLGLAQAVVGGISMGAALALELTLRHPGRVRALVLSRPAWLDVPRAADFKVFLEIASLLRRHGAFEGARRFAATPGFERIQAASPDNARSLLGQFAEPRAVETVAKLEAIPRYAPTFRESDWGRIRVPTLVIANRDDVIHPFAFAEHYASAIPGATLRELTPKSRNRDQHAVDTRRHITEFLARLGG